MCLAIPGKIKSIESQFDGMVRMAKVSFGGIIKEASLEMVPQAKEGDYVLVHVGVAISVVDEEEAKKTFRYLEEMGEVEEELNISQMLPDKKDFKKLVEASFLHFLNVVRTMGSKAIRSHRLDLTGSCQNKVGNIVRACTCPTFL